jgi:4-carboxymuconolactone decarboxylase
MLAGRAVAATVRLDPPRDEWSRSESTHRRWKDDTMTDQHETRNSYEEHGGWIGGQNAFGDFAPAMARYTDKVLFDDVWKRNDLSKRDRSLITVAALTAMGKTEQLQFHIGFAHTNGVTTAEVIEAITHLAFYTGWPNGMSAMTVAKRVLGDESDDAETGM